MTIPSELWKKWEGRVVGDKFSLQHWLGGSEDGAVFLTEGHAGNPQKCAIKLLAAGDSGSDAQLSRWAEAAKLPHPHLIRLFEFGRCQIDGVPLLYVVMEYADETLAEVLPLRALSATEVSEMLHPSAEALASLHQKGFAHGHIKPSNVLAADNQLKLSSDGARKVGERSNSHTRGVYDAPEISRTGPSPAADVWSLGATLLAVLSQRTPQAKPNDPRKNIPTDDVPETIPQPLRGILQNCLQIDPTKRYTTDDLLGKPSPPPVPKQPAVKINTEPAKAPLQRHSNRWISVVLVAAALIIVGGIISKFVGRHPAPVADMHPARQSAPAADVAVLQPTAPSAAPQTPAQKGESAGSVLKQVMPDVSRGAQKTIRGRVKVSVQVAVDPSGNVSEAKLVSAGPSKYFAARALAASRQWRFSPPHAKEQSTASAWVLRFQFGRSSTEVFPSEIKP